MCGLPCGLLSLSLCPPAASASHPCLAPAWFPVPPVPAVQVEFTRVVEEEPGLPSLKHNRRVLFSRMGPYPQRKVITFNRYSHDFNFHINYGDLGFLGPEDLR